jgi:hypothetical protein
MEKKPFETVELNVVVFETMDVIRTSEFGGEPDFS